MAKDANTPNWSPEDLEVINSIGLTILDDIRSHRKEILELVSSAKNSDELAAALSTVMTSLNRSSTFRAINEYADVLDKLESAVDLFKIGQQLQNGEITNDTALLVYEMIADSIFDALVVLPPPLGSFFQIESVRTAFKKGGIVVGDYVGEKMDNLVENTIGQSESFKKAVLDWADRNPEIRDFLRKLDGKPPKGTPPIPAQNASPPPVIQKSREVVQASVDSCLKEKQALATCSVDNFCTAVEQMCTKGH